MILSRLLSSLAVLGILLTLAATPALAQEEAVLAVVDSALARISAEDMVGFTDLMLPEATIGVVGERDGRPYFGMRSRVGGGRKSDRFGG